MRIGENDSRSDTVLYERSRKRSVLPASTQRVAPFKIADVTEKSIALRTPVHRLPLMRERKYHLRFSAASLRINYDVRAGPFPTVDSPDDDTEMYRNDRLKKIFQFKVCKFHRFQHNRVLGYFYFPRGYINFPLAPSRR